MVLPLIFIIFNENDIRFFLKRDVMPQTVTANPVNNFLKKILFPYNSGYKVSFPGGLPHARPKTFVNSKYLEYFAFQA